MRIALHPVGEVGHRTGRILLAERELAALGVYGQRGRSTEDRRSMAISNLAGFDLLITDDEADPLSLAAIAAEDGLSCVLAAEPDLAPALGDLFASRQRTLLVGANLGCGIAEALATHEAARTAGDLEVLVAWTRPGKADRRGEAVPFPQPVGAQWGKRLPPRVGQSVPVTRIEAPVPGPWAAALAQVTGSAGGHRANRLVGVADHAEHLAALALAAGALAVGEGGYPPGLHRPSANARAYLRATLRLGMAVAAFSAEP